MQVSLGIPVKNSTTFMVLFLYVVLGALVFQLFHFGEHVVQAAAWLGGYREAPYMTPVGHTLMMGLGELFYPHADMLRQMMMGNEILHLIGNTIYAFGTLGLLWFVKNKLTIAAAVIETFHLFEHICLTVTAAWLGVPLGMSTLYGMSMDPATLVTLRVWWHFFMNAIPTALTIIALYHVWRMKG